MVINTQSEQQISGVEKAAILLVTLGDQASSELIKELEEDEVQKVSHEVARIG